MVVDIVIPATTVASHTFTEVGFTQLLTHMAEKAFRCFSPNILKCKGKNILLLLYSSFSQLFSSTIRLLQQMS